MEISYSGLFVSQRLSTCNVIRFDDSLDKGQVIEVSCSEIALIQCTGKADIVNIEKDVWWGHYDVMIVLKSGVLVKISKVKMLTDGSEIDSEDDIFFNSE